MNKNLKKVISAVAALSVSASSMAVFAVDFSDVDPTASYAQAVSELSALGVINGYEDGTFGPDKLVTRAEITKMIVDALGEGSQAASGSGINTQFTDVTGAHWAAGYVSTGVADGFIAGMGDGTFAPDENVTYVQAQKMLVAAIGYETYAQGAGGWPNGYKTWAATRGITDGVSANDNDQLTRAQVAQMIDNAMDAPVCVISKYEPDVWGNPQPVLDIMDGEGKDYQTLFTKKHDAYKVYGRVTATAKTSSGVETGMVTFKVEKADNFDDEYIKDDAVTEDMYVGDSKADEYVRTYAEALVQKNEDDEYTIISITPVAANKMVELSALDLDESKTSVENNVMYFYPAGQTRGSQKYVLSEEGVEYYLNGVEMGAFDKTAYETYVKDTTNTIVLQKETEEGSSIAGDYNVIMITTYATAVVDEVLEKADYIQVNFDESEVSPARIRFYTDDEDYEYSITMDGEEIAATDLQEGDVLSIAYDMTPDANGNTDFANSMFYTVLASRSVVEGVKATTAAKDGEIKIGGEEYELATTVSEADFKLSNTYTLYLDAFGRIAKVEEDASTVKLAILASAYTKSNGDYVAELITNNGEVIEAKMDDTVGAAVKATFDAVAYTTNDKGEEVKVAKSVAYPQLVGEYKVNSSGKLTSFTLVDVAASSDMDDEYKAASLKMGGIRLADTTAVLDLSDIDTKDTFKVVAIDSLVDGVAYTAYGYDKSNEGTYRFAIITDGFGGVDSTTELAVFLESGETSDDNGDTYETMTVVIGSEEVTLTVDEDAEFDVTDFAEGDLLVYAVNNDFVTEAYRVFANTASYDELDVTKLDKMLPADIADINADLCDAEEDEVEIQAGLLVKYDNMIALAKADAIDSDENGVFVDLDKVIDITTNDTTVYSYNWANSSKYFGRVVVDDAIIPTATARNDHDKDNNKLYVNGEDGETPWVYAVVRTFDGDEVQEIYQIMMD